MLKFKNESAVFAPAVSEKRFLKFWEDIVEGEIEVQPLSQLLVKYFVELVLSKRLTNGAISLGFTFWDNDPENKRANLIGGYGLDYRLPSYPKRLEYGEGVVGKLLADYYNRSLKGAYVSTDYSNDAYLAASKTILEIFKFKSGIALPVFVRGSLRGIFKLYCSVKLDESVKNNKARLELEGNRLSYLITLAETQFSATLRRRFAEKFEYVDIRIPQAGQEESRWLLAKAARNCLDETLEAIGAVEGCIYLQDDPFAESKFSTDDDSNIKDIESRQIVDEVSLKLTGVDEADGKEIGSLKVRNKRDDTYFSKLDQRILTVVAQVLSRYLAMYLSLSAEAQTYHKQLDRQKHLLETSKTISLELVRTSTEEGSVRALLESINQNFSFSALMFLKADKGQLLPYLSIPENIATRLAERAFHLDVPAICVLDDKKDWTIKDCPSCQMCGGLTVIAGLRQIPVVAPDIRVEPYKHLYADFGVMARSEFIIPIVAHDTLYGVLDMYRSEPGPIEENENFFLQSICNAAAMSFHSRRLFDVLSNIQAEENRGEMARDVVHTLSPITSSMMVYASVLDKSVSSLSTGTLERTQLKAEAAQIKERIDNLRDTLRQQQNLLHHYRSASRTTEALVEEVSLDDIIEDIIEINSNRATGKRINIRTFAFGQRRKIRAIKMDLYLILWNIVNNAIKFTRGGKPSTISITERYMDNMVTVTVRDEGVGISEEDRHKIWQLGFSTPAPGEKVKTSGVGLTTVKDLVKMIEGGDIQVRSKVNSGTEFTLTVAQRA